MDFFRNNEITSFLQNLKVLQHLVNLSAIDFSPTLKENFGTIDHPDLKMVYGLILPSQKGAVIAGTPQNPFNVSITSMPSLLSLGGITASSGVVIPTIVNVQSYPLSTGSFVGAQNLVNSTYGINSLQNRLHLFLTLSYTTTSTSIISIPVSVSLNGSSLFTASIYADSTDPGSFYWDFTWQILDQTPNTISVSVDVLTNSNSYTITGGSLIIAEATS
jgi:hypothetical protein